MRVEAQVEAAAFRRVLGQFATGVTVITVARGDDVHGMTANAFTAVSLEPPLVLFCVAKTARMAAFVRDTHGFGVSILAGDQEGVSRQFAGARKDKAAREVGLAHGSVAPLIAGALAALSCHVEAIHEGGDHWIVVGRVIELWEPNVPRLPLAFFRSRYCHIVERELARPEAADRWSNDAIQVYHPEWSEGDDATPNEREW